MLEQVFEAKRHNILVRRNQKGDANTLALLLSDFVCLLSLPGQTGHLVLIRLINVCCGNTLFPIQSEINKTTSQLCVHLCTGLITQPRK